MAKRTVNKSQLVRDYLGKYPEKGPTAIAQQIHEEHGVNVSGKFVATIKTKLKQSSGSAAAASIPKTSAPAKKKSAAGGKSAPGKPATAAVSAAALSQHIANLKAAAHRLGKDEAKRIIDLF